MPFFKRRRSTRFIDLTDQRFGRLVVLSFWGHDKFGRTRWLCRCDCGNAATPSSNKLRLGETRSCGCLHDEVCRLRATTHGSSKSQLYGVWSSAKGRCHNPTDQRYARYGGRGIFMCEAWRTNFEAFARDMSPRPSGMTLERIDNDGPYSPENCRWATMKEQGRNNSRNRRYTHNGETLLLSEWEERTGIPASALRYRIVDAGWTVERALTTASRNQDGYVHPNAKTEPSIVSQIKTAYKHDGASQAELSRRFGVSQAQVSRIVRGKQWKHIDYLSDVVIV